MTAASPPAPETSRAPSASGGRPAHHTLRGFRNPWPGHRPAGFASLMKWMLARAGRGQFGFEPGPPRPLGGPPAIAQPRGAEGELRITAIGHASFLIQLGPLNILTDPVWSERCSPVQFVGPRRAHPPGVALDALPPIDIVLHSHDHYDHLDDRSVRELARRHPEAIWCAPLGVARLLHARGARYVVERDWWETATAGGAEITCVPAAHFSGRTILSRDSTLWCGWSVALGGRRVYFAGDTGAHPEFGGVGQRLGALDAVLMPIGAYEPRWFMRPVHMDPDEALEAFAALTAAHPSRATVLVPMHWGTFTLTDEPHDEPPNRARAGWVSRGWSAERLWVMAPGETRGLM